MTDLAPGTRRAGSSRSSGSFARYAIPPWRPSSRARRNARRWAGKGRAGARPTCEKPRSRAARLIVSASIAGRRRDRRRGRPVALLLGRVIQRDRQQVFQHGVDLAADLVAVDGLEVALAARADRHVVAGLDLLDRACEVLLGRVAAERAPRHRI